MLCSCGPALGNLLATLNWLIARCFLGFVLVTLRRIDTEDRILVNLFGDQDLNYRKRLSARGPPWYCLGYDREMQRTKTNPYSYSLQGCA